MTAVLQVFVNVVCLFFSMVGVVTRIEYEWAAPAKERVRVMLRWWHGIALQPQVPYVYLSNFF